MFLNEFVCFIYFNNNNSSKQSSCVVGFFFVLSLDKCSLCVLNNEFYSFFLSIFLSSFFHNLYPSILTEPTKRNRSHQQTKYEEIIFTYGNINTTRLAMFEFSINFSENLLKIPYRNLSK